MNIKLIVINFRTVPIVTVTEVALEGFFTRKAKAWPGVVLQAVTFCEAEDAMLIVHDASLLER